MRRIALAAGLACLAAVAAAADAVEPSAKVKAFLGEKAIAALRDPDRVQVYRIENDKRPGGKPAPADAERIQDFAVLGRGKAPDAKWLKRFREVLFSEASYDFEKAKGCEWEPGVAVRIDAGKEKVDILLCFKCDELGVYPAGGKYPIEDFDPARPQLVALVKELFPADAVIQGLK